MKKNRYTNTKIEMENRRELSNNHQVTVPSTKLSLGSLENKHAVVLDDGKTIIYISDKKREREILTRYRNRYSKRNFSSFARPIM